MLRKQLDIERAKTREIDDLIADNKSLNQRIEDLEAELGKTRKMIKPPDFELQASARSQTVTIEELRTTIANLEKKMGKQAEHIGSFKSKEDHWKRELAMMTNTVKREKALSNMFRNFFTKNVSSKLNQSDRKSVV